MLTSRRNIFAALADPTARQTRPLAPDIILVTNGNDHSVNNAISEKPVETWRAHGSSLVETYEFDGELGLPHDLIIPADPNRPPDVVCPALHDLLGADESQVHYPGLILLDDACCDPRNAFGRTRSLLVTM